MVGSEGSRKSETRVDATLDALESGLDGTGRPWELLIDRRCWLVGRIETSAGCREAAAAETPSPPFLLALLRRSAASSNVSLTVFLFRTGGRLTISPSPVV